MAVLMEVILQILPFIFLLDHLDSLLQGPLEVVLGAIIQGMHAGNDLYPLLTEVLD